MKSKSSSQPLAGASSAKVVAPATSESPTTVPSQFLLRRASTGTVDDDDGLDDEHDSENEASERHTCDEVELPEELERDDEDPA
jgi:hypothetical protein